MNDQFDIIPVGMIHKKDQSVFIKIDEAYGDGLLGLDQFSHILVLAWFHENDTEEKRKTLLVHPRGDKANPLTGVFATRSPARPNLIALFTCEILSIEGNVIYVKDIDAIHGTPVIDIKPYIPRSDAVSGARVPWWVKE
jgi:tRNA-Thr(GGU) m(6)t(6)A37 methyltransferase TsaA